MRGCTNALRTVFLHRLACAQRAGGKVGLLQSEELSKEALEGRPYSAAQVARTADAGEHVPWELKRLELAERGSHGQVVLEMGLMGSGTYEYALVLDGRTVASRQMLLLK
jgi:hypothetical protein